MTSMSLVKCSKTAFSMHSKAVANAAGLAEHGKQNPDVLFSWKNGRASHPQTSENEHWTW